MKRVFLLAVIILMAAIPAFAGLDYNELLNPCFQNGGDNYDVEGNVLFNGNGTVDGGVQQWGRGHIAYTLYTGLAAAATSKVSQTVDDALAPGWDPQGTAKLFTWTGWYYTEQGSITLHIGYWDSLDISKPSPADTPDHIIDNVLTPTNNEWAQFNWTGKLDTQPRWIRITAEFTCGGAGVDDMLFSSQCVPEPGSILALASGLIAFGGLALRRRTK